MMRVDPEELVPESRYDGYFLLSYLAVAVVVAIAAVVAGHA